MTKDEIIEAINRKIEAVLKTRVSTNGELIKIASISALKECRSLVEKLVVKPL